MIFWIERDAFMMVVEIAEIVEIVEIVEMVEMVVEMVFDKRNSLAERRTRVGKEGNSIDIPD